MPLEGTAAWSNCSLTVLILLRNCVENHRMAWVGKENLQKESKVLEMSLDCVYQDAHPDLTDLECLSHCLLQPILFGFRAGLFQELPKYLRGYHKCSKDEAVQLAGLIYKVRFNNDRTQLATIPKILKELVPDNLLRAISPDEWKKVRTSAFINRATSTKLYERRKTLSHTTFLSLKTLWKDAAGCCCLASTKPLKDICRPGRLIWDMHLSWRY